MRSERRVPASLLVSDAIFAGVARRTAEVAFVSGRIRRLVFAASIGCAFAHGAGAACKIGVVGELTVDTERNRAVTGGEIGGQPIKVLIDTGSSFSFIWEDAAQRLHLPVNDMRGVQIYGIGGRPGRFRPWSVSSASARSTRRI